MDQVGDAADSGRVFSVGQCVADGPHKGFILAPACTRGFYPVERLFDDEGLYHVVHESKLVAAELDEDERFILS